MIVFELRFYGFMKTSFVNGKREDNLKVEIQKFDANTFMLALVMLSSRSGSQKTRAAQNKNMTHSYLFNNNPVPAVMHTARCLLHLRFGSCMCVCSERIF